MRSSSESIPEYLELWAHEASIPLLDPVKVYFPYSPEKVAMDHIHLTPFAHEILAARTFDWLVAERLVPFENSPRPATSP